MNKHLPGNPYADAASRGDVASSVLAVAYEIRTANMIEHPYYWHELTARRMKEDS